MGRAESKLLHGKGEEKEREIEVKYRQIFMNKNNTLSRCTILINNHAK